MPLSEEHKQKLAEGRERAKQERLAAIERGDPPPKRVRRTNAEIAAASAPISEQPPIDLTQTPEFQAAIQAAVAKALVGYAPNATVAEVEPDLGTEVVSNLIRQLALAIGEVGNQGSGQKLVPPEVLAAREDAERRMFDRIDAARTAVAAGEQDAMPHYRLVAKIIAPLMNGDELIEPLRRGSDNIVRPVEIDWPLAPNLAMVPLNGPAKEIFALFKESIGNQSSVRVAGTRNSRGGAAKLGDAEPVFAETNNDSYALTQQGHAVTAGSATLLMKAGIDGTQIDQRVLRGSQGAAIRGQDPARVNGGPPTMQVRVLGTIAPPAIQNG